MIPHIETSLLHFTLIMTEKLKVVYVLHERGEIFSFVHYTLNNEESYCHV